MAKKRRIASTSKLSPRGERTRAKLVAAAQVVFEKDGFAPARIADIAMRARTAIGSFYTYFDTKESIFRAVVDLVDADLAAPLPSDAGTDPLSRLEAGTRAYVRKYKENARILAALQHRTMEDPELYEIRQSGLRRWVSSAERSISRLKAEGRVPSDVSPRFAATALTGMVHSFCYETFAFGDKAEFDDEEISRGLASLWMRAIGVDIRASKRTRPEVISPRRKGKAA